MVKYHVHFPEKPQGVFRVHLPASKSIANRALIIASMCDGLELVSNISTADDTQILLHYLQHEHLTEINAGHGGTTFRFLLALKAIKGFPCVMTGSSRLKERPIGPLVDALRILGADIQYLEKEGYPPLQIGPFVPRSNDLDIPANISSQFISALLMVGPYIPGGIKVRLMDTVFSKPYISMTIEIMQKYGAIVMWEENCITVEEVPYRPIPFSIEADWSAASYLYALSAFCPDAFFELPLLSKQSLQGDSALIGYGNLFGIQSSFEGDSLWLSNNGMFKNDLEINLLKEPDLSLALAVMCCGLNIKALLSGLDSLRIKETDRIEALDNELCKMGYRLLPTDPSERSFLLSGHFTMEETPNILTYHDHRMAMSMACLSVFGAIVIEDPLVVTKSFPDFWKEMQHCGMIITSVIE